MRQGDRGKRELGGGGAPFDRVWLPTVPSEDDQVAESLILRPEIEGAINRSKPEFKMLSLLGNAGVLHCREELGLGNGCKDSRGWRVCDAGEKSILGPKDRLAFLKYG